MAHESDLEPKQGGDLLETAIVIGAALIGGGVLFAALYVGSLYLWR
jgi:hypothetical protein